MLAANNNGYDAAAHVFVTIAPADASNGALATGFAGNGTTPPPSVPEPGTLALLGSAILVLGMIRMQVKT